MVGKDECLKEMHISLSREVERIQIDPESMSDAYVGCKQLCGWRVADLSPIQTQWRVFRPPGPRRVDKSVTIPEQIESCTCSEFNQIEPHDLRSSRDGEEGR